ncbi:MAG: HAD family hydrolase [Methanocellales archaeon]
MQAVTFDLWHTLVNDSRELSEYWMNMRIEGMLEILLASGYEVERRELLEVYQRSGAIFDELRKRSDKEIDVAEQIEIMLSLLRIESDRGLITKLDKPYTEVVLKKPPIVIAGAEECLQVLKDRGYKLGLISNTGRTPGKVLRQMLREIGLIPYFQHLTFSNEIGLRKPHPAPFIHTLNVLSVQSSEAVHIGDHLKSDIFGAKNAGMKAILYKPLSKLEEVNVKPDGEVENLKSIVEVIEKF